VKWMTVLSAAPKAVAEADPLIFPEPIFFFSQPVDCKLQAHSLQKNHHNGWNEEVDEKV
jgi:hypothetical protein